MKYFDPTSSVQINPGTGPVQGKVTKANAVANMEVLLTDAGLTGKAKYKTVLADGRYLFTCNTAEGQEIEVEMPGLPLEEVRYMAEGNQNIWNFPRLYVDGSSWVWLYAVSSLKGE